ncbi:hypothetical protein L1987_88877 [Smallanthus sonchifolius]|nr:hypothetical protein L1987_89802 [Smallanthus sonchifolius]KAI3666599.1 hypothetical protein L1987_88877 [Smallanthus sonchifolius]
MVFPLLTAALSTPPDIWCQIVAPFLIFSIIELAISVEVILGRAWMASRLALPVVFAVLGGEAILDYVGDENRILYWAILVRCKKRNGAEALIILYSRLGFSCYRRERQRSQGADHYSPIDAVYSRRSVSGAPPLLLKGSHSTIPFLLAAE